MIDDVDLTTSEHRTLSIQVSKEAENDFVFSMGDPTRRQRKKKLIT